MRDRRIAQQASTTHDDSDKENKSATHTRNTITQPTKPAALDSKRSRAAHVDDEHSEQQQQQYSANNKKSKPSHSATSSDSGKNNNSFSHDQQSITPLSPAPTPCFSVFDALLAEKDAAYSQLLDKYNELRKQKLDATAALVAQYESQTNQLRSSSQQLTKHWQDKYEQLSAQQQREAALRKKEAEAAVAVKELALAEKDKQLKEKETLTAELEGSLRTVNEQLSHYLLLTGTSISAPSSPSSSSHRIACCMVNASNRQRRIDFVLDTSQSETDGTVEYRPKRIELGGLAYPKCLKDSMSFAVDRTPNFTRYLLDVLYKKVDDEQQQQQREKVEQAEGQTEADNEEVSSEQAQQPQLQQDEHTAVVEQAVLQSEARMEMEVEQAASEATAA